MTLWIATKKGKVLVLDHKELSVSKLYDKSNHRLYPKGMKIIDLDKDDEVVEMRLLTISYVKGIQ